MVLEQLHLVVVNMAHYAFLDFNNIVVKVIVGKDENEGDINWEEHYAEVEQKPCKRTSYNTWAGEHKLGGVPFRKNYASIGYRYDEQRDAFVPPQNFLSWKLNEDTCRWDPPVPYPTDGKLYKWDETILNWVEIIVE